MRAKSACRSAGADAAVPHRFLHRFGQAQEPEGVGHGAAVLAHGLGHLLLGVAGEFHETLIGLRLFHGVEVFPLYVFDQRELEALFRRDGAEDDGKLFKTGTLSRPEAAFAGDDDIGVGT